MGVSLNVVLVLLFTPTPHRSSWLHIWRLFCRALCRHVHFAFCSCMCSELHGAQQLFTVWLHIENVSSCEGNLCWGCVGGWKDEGRASPKEDEQLLWSYRSESLRLFSVHQITFETETQALSFFPTPPTPSVSCDGFILSRERSGKLFFGKWVVISYEKEQDFSPATVCV